MKKVEENFRDGSLLNGIFEQLSIKKENISFRELNRITSIEVIRKDNEKEFIDLTGLEILKNLEYIEFSGFYLKELEILGNLKKIVHLHCKIYNDKIPDFFPKGIRDLGLSDSFFIENIDNIDCYPNLYSINLDNNSISTIPKFNNLKLLTFLSMKKNFLSNIYFMKEMKNLFSLIINNNFVYKLDALESLEKLEILYANSNRVQIIPCIKNLVELNLDDNPIMKLENLDKMPFLEKISLNNCGLFSFPNLTSSNLKTLSLNNNNLENISMNANNKILELNLSNNFFKNLDFLKKFPFLEKIYINQNEISNLQKISFLKNKKEIYINNQNICVELKEEKNILYMENKIYDYKGILIEPNFISYKGVYNSLKNRIEWDKTNLFSSKKFITIGGALYSEFSFREEKSGRIIEFSGKQNAVLSK